jgi:hypothetical protein
MGSFLMLLAKEGVWCTCSMEWNRVMSNPVLEFLNNLWGLGTE